MDFSLFAGGKGFVKQQISLSLLKVIPFNTTSQTMTHQQNGAGRIVKQGKTGTDRV